MAMMNRCLYCYGEVAGNTDFHPDCATKFFGLTHPPSIKYTIDQMDELAKDVIERSVAVPGVQPKLSMSLIANTKDHSDARLTVVGALGGNFIFKPPTAMYPEMPENEHLTMRIAEVYGIKVVESSLIRLASGELSYITKRIDRDDHGNKIHMIDMFQITEAFDKYKGSMEKVGKALNDYSSNTLLDKTYLFDLTVFSFLFGNNDMHLKNFSMIETEVGWTLSPAYDLLNVSVLIPDDHEELALTLSGKKRKLKREHFELFAESLGLNAKQIKGTFSRMLKNMPRAMDLISKSFLSRQTKIAYRKLVMERYEQLNLK
jgi:serine/threonine-protein kinase HipA